MEGEGPSKSERHVYKGERGLTKVPLCKYFVIFPYAKYLYHTLLSLALTDLLLYKIFAMIILLSLEYFTVFFITKLLIGCVNRFPLDMRGLDEKEYVRSRGVVASVNVLMMGVKFCHCGAYVQIE